MAKNRRTHDVVATVGEYTDASGATKKRYLKCGVVFTDDEGRQSILIEALPSGRALKDWSGYLSLFPVQEQGGAGGYERGGRQATEASRPQTRSEEDEDEGEIPF